MGKHFGGYQVIREIGQGTVARVFLASDGRRAKALKLFYPQHRSRARRELLYGRNLDHPHLNPVEEWLELSGHPGVVMPYVSGVRMTGWLPGDDGKHFLTALAGVLRGLSHLHGLGIVHRDVKPENILVDRSGRSVLVDYDLATGLDLDSGPAPAGTAAFLSPEQARGDAATPESDIYSVGVILYWGITGSVPFTGTVEQVRRAHAQQDPPQLALRESALAPFGPLLDRLLAKEPERRYGNALEVAGVLEQMMETAGRHSRMGSGRRQ